MFGDFLGLAFDQIVNSAAKFQYMYNDQVSTPVIIRTPMGGKRGYGPTHSQSLEKHFLGIPGTQVLALHHRYDPALVYANLFATIDRPTIVIENKLLYGKRLSAAVPEGFHLENTDGVFPTTRLRPEARPDLSILCYGGMLSEVEEVLDVLFEEHDIVAEVIVPTRLYPLELDPILESVTRSGRLLTVEEGLDFCAFGAEVVAQISERRPGILRSLKRLAAPHHAIPSAGPLEKALLPGPAHILAAALALMNDE
jgi:2-oxoisovalerate dehydrogenase E1 component